MKKISLSFLLMCCFMVTQVFAQSSREMTREGYDSDWDNGLFSDELDISSDDEGDVEISSSENAKKPCTMDQQNTLPDKFFFSLLAGKKWNVSHDSSSGKMTFKNPHMISNCNSMLRYNFSKAQNGKPYAFQAEVIRPAGCTADKCKFPVCKVTDPKNSPQICNDKDKEGKPFMVEVKPDYYGFLECLHQTGAYKDNKPVKDMLALDEFKESVEGLYATDEVAYHCHGPECRSLGARYGEVEVESAGKCDYYSKITSTGYTFYSQEDVERKKKESLFNKICKSGDYKDIDDQLPNFMDMADLYKMLQKIRDNLLLDEVKALHEQLKVKDYSSLDAGKFRNVIHDFKIKIINPIIDKIANLQKNTGKNQERINELVDLLNQYAKDPYLTGSDYKEMKSFIKKAPLRKEEWREAAIDLYTVQTSAFNYSRYSSEVRENTNKPELRNVISTAAANKKIEENVKIEKDFVAKLGELDADPTKSYAQDHVRKANEIIQSKYTNYQDMQRFKQQEMQYMYQHCMGKPYVAMNPILQKNCIQGVQQNIAWAEQDAMMFNQSQDMAAQHQYNQANMWAQLEAQRNGRQAQQYQNPYATGNTNLNFTNPGYTSNGQYNPWNRTPAAGGQFPQNYPMMNMYQGGYTGSNGWMGTPGFAGNAGVPGYGMPPGYGASNMYQGGGYNMGFGAGAGFNPGMGYGAGAGFNQGFGGGNSFSFTPY